MIELQIPNMSCGHCVRAITEAVHATDPKAQVTTDLAQHLVRVETHLAADALKAQLTQAGYPPA
jgi:copper chaperone